MKPSLSKTETKNGTLTFTLRGVDVSVANSIRRTMIADVESFVIRTSPYEENQVSFRTNSTRLNNEIIKQRLSCVPVHITDKSFPTSDFEFEIKKENTSHSPVIVTTEDIRVKNIAADTYLPEQEVRAIFPPDPLTGDFISIVRLRPKLQETVPGESLHLTFKLSRGSGKQDGSFTAVCTSSYSFTQDDALVASTWKALSGELKSSGLDENAIRTRYNDWRSIDAKRLTVPNSFDFKVESVGVYGNADLVKEACRIAEESCNSFEKTINTGSLVVGKSPTTIDNSFDIVLGNLDYTFGKVIESILFSKYYESGVLTFCAFKKFHPHDQSGVLRLAFANATEVENVKQYLLSATAEMKDVYAQTRALF